MEENRVRKWSKGVILSPTIPPHEETTIFFVPHFGVRGTFYCEFNAVFRFPLACRDFL
jgi:hypothetical protein